MWFPEDLGDTPFKGCLNFLLHLFHPNNAFAALFFRYFRSEQKKILQFMCKVHNHVWSIIMVCLHWTTTTTSQNKNKTRTNKRRKKNSIDSFSCTSSIFKKHDQTFGKQCFTANRIQIFTKILVLVN